MKGKGRKGGEGRDPQQKFWLQACIARGALGKIPQPGSALVAFMGHRKYFNLCSFFNRK